MTNGLISGYNVMSKHTKEDILDGTVSVMVMSFFCGLGVYSHRLAYRLVGFVCIDIFGVTMLYIRSVTYGVSKLCSLGSLH